VRAYADGEQTPASEIVLLARRHRSTLRCYRSHNLPAILRDRALCDFLWLYSLFHQSGTWVTTFPAKFDSHNMSQRCPRVLPDYSQVCGRWLCRPPSRTIPFKFRESCERNWVLSNHALDKVLPLPILCRCRSLQHV